MPIKPMSDDDFRREKEEKELSLLKSEIERCERDIDFLIGCYYQSQGQKPPYLIELSRNYDIELTDHWEKVRRAIDIAYTNAGWKVKIYSFYQSGSLSQIKNEMKSSTGNTLIIIFNHYHEEERFELTRKLPQ